MAIVREAPNGKKVSFPDGTDEATIQKYLALPRFQVEQEPVENVEQTKTTDRSVIGDMGLQALGGVRDAVQSSIGLVEKLGDTLGEKTNIGGFVFGEDADNGIMQYKRYDELVSEGRSNPIFGKFSVDDAIQLPEVDDADTVAGEVTRGVTQFVSGYFFGGKALKGGANLTSKLFNSTKPLKLVNPISNAGKIAKVTTIGAIADFTAFDEETGRLVDIINEHAPHLQNPLFDYLSSDPDDTFYEARFKNALEGSLIGGALETAFRTFRLIKNRNAERNGEKYSKEQILEDEQFLKNQTDEADTASPNAGKNEEGLDVSEIKQSQQEKEFADEVSKNLEKDLEDSIFQQFQFLQATARGNRNQSAREVFDEGLFNIDLSSSFNLRQFTNLDKQGLLTIDAFEKAFDKLVKSRKVIITDEQVENSAKRLYENNAGRLEIDVKELEQVIRKAPQKIVALNSYIETMASAIKRLSIVSRREPKGKEFLKKVLIPNYKFAIENKRSISSSLGRSLRVSGKVPENPIRQELDTVIKEFDEYGGNFDDFINKIAKTGDADLSKVLSFAIKNKSWNVLNEIWINALLSNPKTHIINISSNIANTILKPLEQLIGSQLTIGVGAKARALRSEGVRAIRTYIGFREYLSDAIKYMAMAFRKEDTIIGGKGGLTKIDGPKSVGGALGSVVRVPTRFLNSADEFFKQINYRSKLKADAVMDAIRLGKDKNKIVGSTLKRRPISEFDAHVLEYIGRGFDEFDRGINKNAMRYAQESTYTQDLTGIFKRMQDIVNEYPILRQVVPFVRTPVNLMLNIVDRTPLGLIRKQVRENFLGRNGPELMAQARGQLAVGTSLMVYASMLYREGYITGVQGTVVGEKTTTSRDLAELRKSGGTLPYAFRYFDEKSGTYKYIQFGRADPFGAFFGVVADYNEVYTKLTEEEAKRVGGDILLMLAQQGGDVSDYISPTAKISNALQAGSSSISRNLFSKTYLKGLADFMQVLTEDNPNKLARYVNSKVGSFIPNIYTKLVNDPFYRDVRSILDEAKKRTGTGEVELKYDFRGQPLKIQGDETDRLINGMFNPFAYSEQSKDPVASEILSLGVNVPKMNEKLQGNIDLTLFVNDKGQTGYNRLQEILRETKIGGKTLDQALLKLINSKSYDKLSEPIVIDDLNKTDGGKIKAIKKIVKKYHELAEIQLIREAKLFKSTVNKKGDFTLIDSLKVQKRNKGKLNTGRPIDNDDIKSLYQFSNNL
tara:strand:+ start:376 stop:4089 length:3714 start_codon:yes stop_codon:yes gene_type:complete